MQPRFDRGYTGHEHMCGFGLINMNGRLYDPYLQRFLSPDPYVQAPANAQNYNRYSYCLNNPLMFTDPSGYWFGWDDLVAAGVGAVVGYVSYGISTGNWGGKAFAAAAIGAGIAWVGWNTMGAGTAALKGGAGSAGSFAQGMTAVFGAKGGYFGAQFAGFTMLNTLSNRESMNKADEKGWGGVWAFGGYAASAMLQTFLKPFTKSMPVKDVFTAFLGVTLQNNINDNFKDGEWNLNRLHVGFGGYNFENGSDYWIWSKGLSTQDRFNMGLETVLGVASFPQYKYRGPWYEFNRNRNACRPKLFYYRRWVQKSNPFSLLSKHVYNGYTTINVGGVTPFSVWYLLTYKH